MSAQKLPNPPPEEAQPIVNRMTSWQRNQWARAKYPKDRGSLESFATLERERIEDGAE